MSGLYDLVDNRVRDLFRRRSYAATDVEIQYRQDRCVSTPNAVATVDDAYGRRQVIEQSTIRWTFDKQPPTDTDGFITSIHLQPYLPK
jgi:hypothetical protein